MILIKSLLRNAKALFMMYIILTLSLYGINLVFDILWEKDFSPRKFMSYESIHFSVNQVKLDDDLSYVYYKDMTEEFKTTKEDYLFYISYSRNDDGIGIYTNNDKLFKPRIMTGKNFEENDFIEGTNTVLLSSAYKEMCIEEGGKHYFLFDGVKFEVIGIYEKSLYEPNYYINFGAKSLRENLLSGECYFEIKDYDQKANSDVIQEIFNTYALENNTVIIDEKYNNKTLLDFIEYILSLSQIIFIYFIPLLLVFLNLSALFDLWLEQRKNEIMARYSVYLEKEALKKLIMKDHFVIALISYVIGSLLLLFLSHYFKPYMLKLNGTMIKHTFFIYWLLIIYFSKKLYRLNITTFFEEIGKDWY